MFVFHVRSTATSLEVGKRKKRRCLDFRRGTGLYEQAWSRHLTIEAEEGSRNGQRFAEG